ncbi:MAG: hypothetical protein ABW033_05290, partial [Acidimicrobiia bacterium]
MPVIEDAAPRTGPLPGPLPGPVPWRFLALVTTSAFFLRLGYCWTIAADTFGAGDAYYYHYQGNLLAKGRGFIDPFFARQGRVFATANHSPAWPVLLAGASLFGLTSYADHRAVGSLPGAVSVLLVGVLGTRLAGPTVGKIAAVVAALNPVLIAADGSLMSESLYGVFVLLAVLVGVSQARAGSYGRSVALGGCIGLAALTRSEGIVLLVLLAAPAVWLSGGTLARRGGQFAAALLACALVIAPWAIRNTLTFDRFVPLSTNGGSLLAGANCAGVYSGDDIGGWHYDCLSYPVGDNPATQDAIWNDEGRQYMLDHLDQVPEVVAARVLRTWGLFEPRPELDEGVPSWFATLGVVFHWVTIPLILFGLYVGWRRKVTLWPFASLAALVTLSSAYGWGVTRFRHIFELASCVLIALACNALWT